MVAINQIRDEYRLEASAVGVDATVAAAGRLAGANEGVVSSSEKVERRTLSVAAALDRFARANDNAYKMQQSVERGQALVNRAMEQGLAGTTAYDVAVSALSRSESRLAQAAAQAAQAHNDNAAALARTRAQYDPLFAAQLRLRESLVAIADAEKSGAISANLAMQARIKATSAMRDQTSAIERQSQVAKAAVERQVAQVTVTPDRGVDIAAYGAQMDALRAKFDPLFAAGRQYRAELAEMRQALTVGAISEDAYTAALDRRKASFTEQVRGLGLLSKAERDASAAAAEAARAMEQRASAAAKTGGQWAALSGQGAAQGAAFAASEKLAAQWRAFGAQGAAQVRALKSVEVAQLANTKATTLHAQAWTSLGYQVNDVFTSLASGASPFMVIAQQGGQIYQALDGPRGVTGGLKEVGNFLLRLATPANLVFGGLAVGAIAAAVAAYRFVAAQRDVELALLGAGRGAGVTADQVQAIAERASRSSEITVAGAREIEKAFIRTGGVMGGVFAQGITAAENFAKATGQDRAEAAQVVARGLSTLGSGGYEDLAKKAGNFDAALDDQVRALLNTGRTMEAQILVADRFGQAFATAQEKMTGLQRFLGDLDQRFKNLAESTGKAVANIGKPLPVQEQLDRAVMARGTLRAVAPDVDTSAADNKIAGLRRDLRNMGAEAELESRRVRQNADAAAKGAIQSLVSEAATYERVQAQKVEANKALNALELQGGDPVRIAAASEAVARAAAAERDFAVAGGPANMERYKANEVLRAGLQALQAKAPEERAEAARQQALAAAFGTVTSSAERTNQSTDAYRRTLAEARQASVDQSRSMNDQTTTANVLAEATAKQGKSVEYLSAARKVEEQIRAGTFGEDEREAKIKEELESRIASLSRQTAERTRAQNDNVQMQQRLNDKVAAGTMVSAQAQRVQASEIELARVAVERDAASGEAKAALARRYDELRASTEAQLSVEDRARVLGMTEDEGRRIKMLEREAELVGETVVVRARELAILQAKQGLDRQGISTTTPESRTYLDKVALRSDVEVAKAQYERMAQDISSVVSGIFDDMFKAGNKGLDGFLDSFSRGFSRIGTRLIEQNVIAPLLGGQGGFAGGGSGFDITKIFDTKAIEKAVGTGAEDGIVSSFRDLLKPAKGADGKTGGFASSPLGGGLVAGLAGASIGYQSQSPLMGVMGGALAGASLGPVGAVVGAGAGLIGGLLGQSAAKKERAKQIQEQLKAYREAYEEAKPQIEELGRTFRGEATGGVGGQIDAAFAQMKSGAVTASKGGDQAAADKLVRDFEGFTIRLRQQFVAGFEGTLRDLSAGLGPSGPFGQAVSAVAVLGESLKSFVKDSLSLPDVEQNSARARAAATEAALASLSAVEPLSAVQSEMMRIDGTAAGLGQVLRDLGMSADDAATAIRERTAKAMDALREAFDRDLAAKVNEATGRGYLNEAADLLKEIGTISADRALVGGDAGQVEAYLRAAGQKIVDEAELTGTAFDDLVTRFPTLQGKVVEFSAALDTAAAKAAAASRALGFQDRRFAAGNDASTLEGQLAAYDRQARREREEEVKAGGEAIADMEAAQLAERLKIVRDYNQAAAESTRQTMEQAKSAYDTFARSIRDFVDGLSAGPESTLSPAARLAAAQSTYSTRLTGAKTGNRDDLDGITGNASDLLDAARDYYGSSAGYQGVLNAVKTQLTALPKQVSAEQFIVNAIDASKATLKAAIEANSPTLISDALTINFDALDTTLDGLLDVAEFKAGLGPLATKAEQDAAELLFKAIDTNGDGLLTKTELMRGQLLTALAANSPALIATALNTNFTKLDTSVNGLLDYAEFTAGLGPLATKAEQDAAEALFKSIDENSDGMLSALELLRTVLKTAIEANSPAALATALTANFDKLDTSVNGQLDYNELTFAIGHLATVKEQADARRIFDAIDANGDGQLDKLELVRARAAGIEVQTEATKTASESANTIANQQKAILDAQSVLLKSLETIGTQQSTFLDAIKTLTTSQEATLRAMNTMAGTQKDQLIALNNQFRTDPVFLNGTPLQNNMVTALNKIVYNTANTVIAVKNNNFGSVAYASGGLVTGPGTGTSDSIQSRLSNGEFVLTAEATRRIGVSTLNAMNDNRGFDLPAVAMPVPMSLPMPVGGGSNNAALIAEIRALREEVAALRAEQRDGNDIAEAGHLQTIGAVKGTTAAVEDGNRTASRQQLRKTG
ncbi:hypothetical protein ASG40_19405 [Methylobacterium sp. Leaf399]|uniref:phage tail length tape measure family protein n=1 Tax=Methylobacterium sp. Leaf399 TaxID=1736364 RepID=UPI0006FA7E0A|nr:phage tail length tape measure family protein [Methylobacterium sp. Leaf399]KQT13995.1 hypothetical protein ASG40_19405 [Methylobacterium sp. Leaf399]